MLARLGIILAYINCIRGHQSKGDRAQFIGGRCRIVGTNVQVSGNNKDDLRLSQKVLSHNLDPLVSKDLANWESIDATPIEGDLKKKNNKTYHVVNRASNLDSGFFVKGWQQVLRNEVYTLGVACVYKEAIYYMADIRNPIEGISLVYITVTNSSGTYELKTKGEYPHFYWGYSAGYSDGVMYLAGSEDSIYKNRIYALNLTSLKWNFQKIENFKGTTSGCIAIGQGFLVHLFGSEGPSINQKIQIINTTTWQKIPPTQAIDSNKPFFHSIPFLILASAFGILVSLNVLYFIRRLSRNYNNNKPPSLICPREIWSNPTLSFEADLTFSGELVFDCDTLSNLKTRLSSPLTNAYRDLPSPNKSIRSPRCKPLAESNTFTPSLDFSESRYSQLPAKIVKKEAPQSTPESPAQKPYHSPGFKTIN